MRSVTGGNGRTALEQKSNYKATTNSKSLKSFVFDLKEGFFLITLGSQLAQRTVSTSPKKKLSLRMMR